MSSNEQRFAELRADYQRRSDAALVSDPTETWIRGESSEDLLEAGGEILGAAAAGRTAGTEEARHRAATR
jgi:hypothetical protein